MFTATADLSEFHDAVARTKLLLLAGKDEIARETAKAVRDEAKRGTFKDQSGALRGTIEAHPLSSGEWEVVAPQPYALYVEDGTEPHPIFPQKHYSFKGPLAPGQGRRSTPVWQGGKHASGVLRFVIGGRVIYARSVFHPGTRAYAFMGHAYTKGEATIYATAERVCERIAARWD